MTDSNHWLLPDGIDEVLPPQAWRVEALRRQLLDLYRSWGYELVIPPYIEYLDSLLTGVGEDLDLKTFKVTDQLSGRMMGIRADMTPQVARIDAHSLRQQGVTRLCYGGSVLHTRANNMLSSRSPIQLGAEIYGSADKAADIEVISLMVATLNSVGLDRIHLDLGHIEIYQGLVEAAGLSVEQEQAFFGLVQRKAKADIGEFIRENVVDSEMAHMLLSLCDLHGESALTEAKTTLAAAPERVKQAIAELEALAGEIAGVSPQVTLYYDLAELRGYQYHTGFLFSAYVPGYGRAVAKGGRYDNIGEAFGRARPATGFSADLKALAGLSQLAQDAKQAIAAPAGNDEALAVTIQALRAQGEIVVRELGEGRAGRRYSRRLEKKDGQWVVTDVTN